jgi:hypothetical protein
MTRTLTIAYKFSHYHREKIFAILVTAILLSAGAYIVLLQKAIINVVQREKVVAEARSLSVDVSELEEQYFAAKNKITLDLAHSKGLQDAEHISYISKKPVTAFVSNNEL